MNSVVCITSAGILWGIIAIFISLLKDLGFNSLQCVAIRVFFSALCLVIYLSIFNRSKLKIEFRDIIYFLGTGIFSIIFFNYCYFEAIEVIGGVAIPALLLYMAPIFVMIMSFFFFHEKLNKRKVLALFITIIGLCFITGAFSQEVTLSGKAILLGLGAGFGYALYSIFSKMIIDKYEAVTIITYTFVVAAIGSIPLSGIIYHVNELLNLQAIIATIGLAIFCTVMPFLLYTTGLKKLEAGKASILATIEPIVSAIVGLIFFQEVFDLTKILGMICIISAILILNLNLVKAKSIN